MSSRSYNPRSVSRLLTASATDLDFAPHSFQLQRNNNTNRHDLTKKARPLYIRMQRNIFHMPWLYEITMLLARAFFEELGMTDGGMALIQEAECLLDRYEQRERISLLQLAVWKYSCMADLPDHKLLTSLAAWKLWEKDGWKVGKKKHFQSNEVVILMDAVVPFLQDQAEGEGEG
ncbi:hypothetical protein ACA910_001959 [Epithemia clementina (nom. ined.)]